VVLADAATLSPRSRSSSEPAGGSPIR
jgi:hypothetical protein